MFPRRAVTALVKSQYLWVRNRHQAIKLEHGRLFRGAGNSGRQPRGLLPGNTGWRALFATQFVCHEGVDGFQDFCKQFWIAGNQVAIFQEIMATAEVAGEAPGFLDQ